jgi:hypothetical protein
MDSRSRAAACRHGIEAGEPVALLSFKSCRAPNTSRRSSAVARSQCSMVQPRSPHPRATRNRRGDRPTSHITSRPSSPSPRSQPRFAASSCSVTCERRWQIRHLHRRRKLDPRCSHRSARVSAPAGDGVRKPRCGDDRAILTPSCATARRARSLSSTHRVDGERFALIADHEQQPKRQDR